LANFEEISMSSVTTTTIVNEMWDLVTEIKGDKKLDIEKKVKLMTTVTDRMLRAGALNLAYQRAVARLPENAASLIPHLNAVEEKPSATRQ
jgi:hypothetical protein